MLPNTCCCCISLRNGTLIIGALSLIVAIINVVSFGIEINQIETMDVPKEAHDNVGLLPIFKMFFVSMLIYVLLNGIFAGLMIFGTVKKLPSYLFPWIAIGFAGLIGAICIYLGALIVTVASLPVGVFFCILFLMGSIISLQIYFWLIVYSHYKEVVAEKYGHQTRPADGKILNIPQMIPYHNV